MNSKDEESHFKKFGNHIKSLRLERKWSIADVGGYLDVSSNYISLMERGMRPPTDEMLEKIADLYKVEEDDLYYLLGKIPKSVLNELETLPVIQKAMSMVNKKKIPEEKKKAMIEEILRVYAEFLEINKDEFENKHEAGY